MAWIIWNKTQHKWVGPSGGKSSFVGDRPKARRFETRQAAEADCCGDEVAVEAREII